MNTTYILHGGATKKDNLDNELFFKYFTEFVEKDSVKILMCYFAREKEEWDGLLESAKTKISNEITKQVSLTIANDPEDLLNKLQTHDVLYVDGGEAEFIEPLLPQLAGLKHAIKGKVYIGSSMGAFIVSSQYVLSFDSQDTLSSHRGLGLLPFNTLCHWNVEKKKEEKITLLKKSSPDFPILTLDEGKMAMFVQ